MPDGQGNFTLQGTWTTTIPPRRSTSAVTPSRPQEGLPPFAAWKMSLRERGYTPEPINHYLSAVRPIHWFAEDAGLLRSIPRLRRVRNEPRRPANGSQKALYGAAETKALLDHADVQVRVMIPLGLNCGLGPKDIQDIHWEDIDAVHRPPHSRVMLSAHAQPAGTLGLHVTASWSGFATAATFRTGRSNGASTD